MRCRGLMFSFSANIAISIRKFSLEEEDKGFF